MGLTVLTSANYTHITFPAYSTSAKKTSKFYLPCGLIIMANLPSNFYTNALTKIGNDIILKNPQGTKTKSVFLTITNTTFMSWAFSSTRFQK
jgi:hypothetical protein